MNISSVKTNIYVNKKNNLSDFKTTPASFKNNVISFGGDSLEMELAKKYLGQENWQEEYREKRLNELLAKFNKRVDDMMDPDIDNKYWVQARLFWLFWFVTIPTACVVGGAKEKAANEQIDKEIRQINDLMIALNNNQLDKNYKEQMELQAKQKALKHKILIQDKINKNFILPLQESKKDESIPVPTALMLYGGFKKQRDEMIEYIKNNIDSRAVLVDLPDDEDSAFYRIETEIDYALNYYSKSNVRTVLFVENFDSILNPQKTSHMTIGDMKELMSSLNKDKAPLSIVFQTNDKTKIDDAFIANEIRIPCKINLDEVN